ncbi:MAG: bifunctional ADP-heptose synthase [Patescibacteria group bacterium]
MLLAENGQILKKFKQVKVLVVGDVMLDSYIYGSASRLSVEAPVPILTEQSRRHVLGGAANVANNIAQLGGTAYLLGVVGNDQGGEVVKKLCRDHRISLDCLVVNSDRPTATKTRVVAQHHQLLRIDHEIIGLLPPKTEKALIQKIKKIPHPDVIIFSDYAKGTITASLLKEIINRFPRAKMLADFKPSKAMLYRKRIDVIMPNTVEALGLVGIDVTDNRSAQRTIKKIIEDFSSDVVLKRGAQGMTVFERATQGLKHIPTTARSVFDVTGAGDTVIAAFGLSLGAGADIWKAADIANQAAGIVVEMSGTAAVTLKDLSRRLA